MESQIDGPRFTARASGTILLIVLVVSLLAGAALNSVLDYFRAAGKWGFLVDASDEQFVGTRLVVQGVIDPLVTICTIFLLLKFYFPNKPTPALLAQFGLRNMASLKLMLTSFLIGVGYTLLFTKVLMNLFPANEFVAPHPANAAANAQLWAQLLYALCAVTIVPIVEEFLFRGVLYTGFSASWNRPIAALVVSLIFIAFHPDTIRSGYWVTHASLYVIPFVLVLAREITGSLVSSIMIHSGVNFGVIFIP